MLNAPPSPSSPPLTPRRAAQKAALGVGVTAALLLLVEGALTLALPPPGPIFNLRSGIQWSAPEKLDGALWKQVSSAREFTVTTNADGLRSLAVTDGYAPEATRILCVGDSIVFGWGLDDPHTYPAQLERVLRSALPDQEVQVFNAGHPGYSTVQSYLWLQHLLPRVRPHVVVLALAGHNYRSAEKPDRLYVESDSDVTSVNYWLLKHSTLYRTIRRGILATRVPSEEEAFHLGQMPAGGNSEAESGGVVRVPPEDLKSVLSSLAEQGRREGFKVAVYFNLQSTHRPPSYLSVIEALDLKGDITYLAELEPNFTAANGRSETYWFEDDRGHYNQMGAMLVANLVAQSLMEHHLVGAGPTAPD